MRGRFLADYTVSGRRRPAQRRRPVPRALLRPRWGQRQRPVLPRLLRPRTWRLVEMPGAPSTATTVTAAPGRDGDGGPPKKSPPVFAKAFAKAAPPPLFEPSATSGAVATPAMTGATATTSRRSDRGDLTTITPFQSHGRLPRLGGEAGDVDANPIQPAPAVGRVWQASGRDDHQHPGHAWDGVKATGPSATCSSGPMAELQHRGGRTRHSVHAPGTSPPPSRPRASRPRHAFAASKQLSSQQASKEQQHRQAEYALRKDQFSS